MFLSGRAPASTLSRSGCLPPTPGCCGSPERLPPIRSHCVPGFGGGGPTGWSPTRCRRRCRCLIRSRPAGRPHPRYPRPRPGARRSHRRRARPRFPDVLRPAGRFGCHHGRHRCARSVHQCPGDAARAGGGSAWAAVRPAGPGPGPGPLPAIGRTTRSSAQRARSLQRRLLPPPTGRVLTPWPLRASCPSPQPTPLLSAPFSLVWPWTGGVAGLR